MAFLAAWYILVVLLSSHISTTPVVSTNVKLPQRCLLAVFGLEVVTSMETSTKVLFCGKFFVVASYSYEFLIFFMFSLKSKLNSSKK